MRGVHSRVITTTQRKPTVTAAATTPIIVNMAPARHTPDWDLYMAEKQHQYGIPVRATVTSCVPYE